MQFIIQDVPMPKKAVERSATGSQYDVVRTMPVGRAFFVPCNDGEDLNKCMRRVSSSCIRIAADANVRLAFRSLDAETAGATFGDAAKVQGYLPEEMMEELECKYTSGVGVWRIAGEYNRRGPRTAADTGPAEIVL